MLTKCNKILQLLLTVWFSLDIFQKNISCLLGTFSKNSFTFVCDILIYADYEQEIKRSPVIEMQGYGLDG